ncbi:hypothetical protein [Roseomonas indoligenes]|uniref:Uncharacterized protein n=1 Tax=Roseomonas indoligenes TaxID=2820811 RepID=A0A940MWJ1_9PROT|nr:hypothetical protein [Pararoseomonas indoligenes]MBP0492114.1 hypothetical protein [Pararoseomonas indoligenes]
MCGPWPWPRGAALIAGLSATFWIGFALAAAVRREPVPSPIETLESIAMAATRPGRDPAATLAAIAETVGATQPLSDQGRMQFGAALSDFAKIRGGVLPYADQQGAVALFLNRLAAHGLVLREKGR